MVQQLSPAIVNKKRVKAFFMDCARSLVAVVSVFQKIHDENNLNLIKSDKMLLCLDGWMDGWMDG